MCTAVINDYIKRNILKASIHFAIHNGYLVPSPTFLATFSSVQPIFAFAWHEQFSMFGLSLQIFGSLFDHREVCARSHHLIVMANGIHEHARQKSWICSRPSEFWQMDGAHYLRLLVLFSANTDSNGPIWAKRTSHNHTIFTWLSDYFSKWLPVQHIYSSFCGSSLYLGIYGIVFIVSYTDKARHFVSLFMCET